jgi:lysozyme family protein
MQSVSEIANEIVAREGGYVNDPDDPGGATNYGVTIHTMRRLGLDLDNDGVVTAKDVRKLTRDKAVRIFIDHYFHDPKIDQLPSALQPSVFDMNVNAGRNAFKVLQRLLNDFGLDVTVDGALGPQTIKAAHKAFEIAPRYLADAYGIERRNYYYQLADRRKASRKYARRRDGGKGGWITRAEAFMSSKYQFSKQEHSQRVSAWG